MPEAAEVEAAIEGSVETARPRPSPAPRRPAAGDVTPRSGNGAGRTTPAPPAGVVRRRAPAAERRQRERRRRQDPVPFPDRRLSRSAYEQVFLKLVAGERLRIGRETYTPIGMKGWYHAVFRRDSDGHERLLTIDQLLRKMKDWQV